MLGAWLQGTCVCTIRFSFSAIAELDTSLPPRLKTQTCYQPADDTYHISRPARHTAGRAVAPTRTFREVKQRAAILLDESEKQLNW